MKVKIDSKLAFERIVEKFDSFIKDPIEMKRVGKQILSDLKTGYINQQDPDGGPTKTISDNWDKRRKRLATVNSVSKFTKLGSKNTTLSFTGQFLKSLKSKYENGLIIIEAIGSHIPYKNIRKGSGKAISNSELFGYLSEWYGRTLIRVSDKSTANIKTIFLRYLRRKV
jgi:hypothetical protein